ncbi:hypothetical protein [Brucella anthropi]|uniref:hypothetical protein n=1 Tax=Brucella anthropi TaxID=529 RepID=UPI0021576461|nr:hypothetical protein [Brucella anthropi]MCR8493417.1 hypothetical protein [Brucella anthropi]
MTISPSNRMHDSLRFDGNAIVFKSVMTPVIRLFTASFAIPFLALLPRYIRDLPESYALASSVPKILLTLFFQLLPVALFVAAVYLTLFFGSIRLRLDPDRQRAEFTSHAPLRKIAKTYPLQEVKIAYVALEVDHPAYDEPHVVLKFPDGRKLRMECFYDDRETETWVAAIRALITPRDQARKYDEYSAEF